MQDVNDSIYTLCNRGNHQRRHLGFRRFPIGKWRNLTEDEKQELFKLLNYKPKRS